MQNSTHTSQGNKSDIKSDKTLEKKNSLGKVVSIVLNVPICIANAKDLRSNVKMRSSDVH